MPTGQTGTGGSVIPGRHVDSAEGSEGSVSMGGSERTGRASKTSDDSDTRNTACSGSAIESIGYPTEGSACADTDGPGDGRSGWKPPLDDEFEQLAAGRPQVEIQPWGEHALAVMLRSDAPVMDLRTVMRFLPEGAVFEGIYGDVEFAVVFQIPHGAES